MRPIRNAAKAIIIVEDRVLCIKKRGNHGFYFILPGGGQKPGETLSDALKRECREELSVEIAVHDLRFVRDYIGRNHEFAESGGDVHQVEFMFFCALEQGSEIEGGHKPDEGQVGFEWLPLDRLENYPLYPKILKSLIPESARHSGPVYLGDVN